MLGIFGLIIMVIQNILHFKIEDYWLLVLIVVLLMFGGIEKMNHIIFQGCLLHQIAVP